MSYLLHKFQQSQRDYQEVLYSLSNRQLKLESEIVRFRPWKLELVYNEYKYRCDNENYFNDCDRYNRLFVFNYYAFNDENIIHFNCLDERRTSLVKINKKISWDNISIPRDQCYICGSQT